MNQMPSQFPRTTVGGLSVSRLVIGTNWLLGWSHCTKAMDDYIRTEIAAHRAKLVAVLETYVRAGVDTIVGLLSAPAIHEAILETEQRTGRKIIRISTPMFSITPDTPAKGLDLGEVARLLDVEAAAGTHIFMPHQATTDALLDRCTRKIRHLDTVCRLVRERNLIPGLSTHMPEAIIYADESKLDVETYVSIYNAVGFMMQIEVDWTHKVIHGAAKPVLTIKPLAAGRLPPFQGLAFAWSTIRPQDLVAVGAMTAAEAAECIELSLGFIEGRDAQVKLQETRSKKSVKAG
jgi:hypothetical protein